MKLFEAVFGEYWLITMIFFLVVSPFILIWIVNSLALAGGSSFHLDFNIKNWFLVFLFVLVMRGW